MPQRFLKPGLISSQKWDACSWMAQSFYIRLLTLVDDFGRFEAEPILLRNLAFPLREDIRTPQVQQLGDELQANQLAVFYKVDGKSYLQLTNWTERTRSDKSKFPNPPAADSCAPQRIPAESCGILPSKSSSSPSSSPSVDVCPTLDEVKLLADKTGLPPLEAEKFYNYYSANGWKVGKNKMKSLPHAIANWKLNWSEKNANNNPSNKPRVDGNAGTANDGKASQYRGVGKVV